MTGSLPALVEMTRVLGRPDLNYAIIGEGNTSCRIDDESFWVKASGQKMHGITAEGFVAVRFAPFLNLLWEGGETIPAAVMDSAKVDSAAQQRPSVEAAFHALLLVDCRVNFIGHTHPVAINRILCSSRAAQFAANRMFPDEVVLCGPESAFVPYVDPGLPLAQAIRQQVHTYMDKWAEAPKVILMANHGLIALGQTLDEVLNVTAMCVKAAEIFAGACAVGEPVFLSGADILHIYHRPDEIYRRRRFVTPG